MTDEEILMAFRQKRDQNRKKKPIRPKFTLYKELFQIVFSIFVLFVIVYFDDYFSKTFFIILLCAVCILIFLTQIKNLLLLFIFLYQRFAPTFIRNACLYTPSCSEYMRLSILKYGVIRGVIKGFKRLKRCVPPNGGIDEP